MKRSDNVLMTINLGGELIELDVKFDEQNEVRDAEREVKLFIDRMKKQMHENSDRKLLAMAAFQFAKWYLQLIKIQNDAIEIADLKCHEIEDITAPEDNAFQDEISLS